MHDPDLQIFPKGSIGDTFGDQSAQFMEKIAAIAPSILYVFDLVEMRNIWVNRSMFLGLGYTADEVAELGSDLLQTLMHPDDMARYPDHFKRLKSLEPEQIVRFEYRMKGKDGSWHWLQSEEMAFTYAEDGSVSQIVGSAHDVSEAHSREERITLLVREMNHRIKNLFAVIWSIIALTAKTKGSVPTAEAFKIVLGRVKALSVSQSLSMPSADEDPASFRELVDLILAPYKPVHDIQIWGDNPSIAADQAQSLAMVLHEMATNAVKYGSLASENGQLFIEIDASQNEGGARKIRLIWTELSSGGLQDREQTPSTGFGSKLIQRSIQQAHGTVQLDWQPSGLCATIEFPLIEHEPHTP